VEENEQLKSQFHERPFFSGIFTEDEGLGLQGMQKI
jgi:hypothetical protein